jgi:hypothetical protein
MQRIFKTNPWNLVLKIILNFSLMRDMWKAWGREEVFTGF